MVGMRLNTVLCRQVMLRKARDRSASHVRCFPNTTESCFRPRAHSLSPNLLFKVCEISNPPVPSPPNGSCCWNEGYMIRRRGGVSCPPSKVVRTQPFFDSRRARWPLVMTFLRSGQTAAPPFHAPLLPFECRLEILVLRSLKSLA